MFCLFFLLLYVAVRSYDIHTCNDRWRKNWKGKDLEGNDCDLIAVLSRKTAGHTEDKNLKLSFKQSVSLRCSFPTQQFPYPAASRQQLPHPAVSLPSSFLTQQSPSRTVSPPSSFPTQQSPSRADSLPSSLPPEQFPHPAVSLPSNFPTQQFPYPAVSER
jgi:hypothetical protein